MSSFSQSDITESHIIVLAAELASQHLYKWPELDSSSHDDRVEMRATWKHLISHIRYPVMTACSDERTWPNSKLVYMFFLKVITVMEIF